MLLRMEDKRDSLKLFELFFLSLNYYTVYALVYETYTTKRFRALLIFVEEFFSTLLHASSSYFRTAYVDEVNLFCTHNRSQVLYSSITYFAKNSSRVFVSFSRFAKRVIYRKRAFSIAQCFPSTIVISRRLVTV